MLNHAQLARADINLLLVFDLLYEEGNAGRAAARLNLSPSAISHALKRLRAVLGDPLFVPTAKGMAPTDRAHALAPTVREILERAHGVIANPAEFDPATVRRRFRVGAPDGTMSMLTPRLVERLEATAPGIDLAILQVLPTPGTADAAQAWRGVLAELENHRIDLAILPYRPPQPRFRAVPVYSEDFVIAVRRGHPLSRDPSLEALAAARHVLVSATGDSSGFVDRLLAERGVERRIALTVPSFLMAAAAIASSDLVGALPRRFAMDAARAHAILLVEPPFPIPSTDLHVLALEAAMLDRGIAWLADVVTSVCQQAFESPSHAHMVAAKGEPQ